MKKSSHCEGLGTSNGWRGVWLEQKERGQNGWSHNHGGSQQDLESNAQRTGPTSQSKQGPLESSEEENDLTCVR